MSGKFRTIVIHLSVWIFYTIFAIIVYGYGHIYDAIWETSFSYIISASTFYMHAAWLLPKFFERKKTAAYIIGIGLLYTYNLAIRYFFFVLYPSIFSIDSSVIGLPAARVIITFSWQWCTFMLFSTGYWLSGKLIQAEKIAREKERLQLEVAALKAQINPHFLFNTLNSFRIEAQPVLPEMSRSITSLITLLRSAFSNPEHDGMIPVEMEIKTVESLINIYQRRFPYIQLQYIKQLPDPCHFRIPPHILLTFVENAFKHGDFITEEKKLCIDINISETSLALFTFNKKDYRIDDETHGIGMKYIIRQLESSFPGRYTLDIEDKEDDYTVHLKIKKQ